MVLIGAPEPQGSDEKFMTIDEVLQEMIDDADRNGNGKANEVEFTRIMKKTEEFAIPQLEALRAPSPTGTPRPAAMFKVRSPPKGLHPAEPRR